MNKLLVNKIKGVVMVHLHAVIEDTSISKQIVDILKTFSSVKKIELEDDEPLISEQEVLDGFREGVREIKAIQDGKVNPSELQDFGNFMKELEADNA
jgi:Asp-tRNA(Asn)/Glu-tRNA(Gln) amidotransferase C subunit